MCRLLIEMLICANCLTLTVVIIVLVNSDILHVFSYLPRDLNFLAHTSDFGWKE